MALEGCYGCIKYLMFAFNFLFWILGCVILGIGIWIKVDPSSIMKATRDEATIQSFLSKLNYYGYESTGAYILITVGAVIMVIGFLGCCGAIRESQFMLILFFIFLAVIFVALLVAGVYVIIMKDKLKAEITNSLRGEIQRAKAGEGDAMRFLNVLQDKLQCCGNEQGVADYGSYNPTTCKQENKYSGCSPRLYSKLSQNYVIIGGVAIGIALVMFLGMVFSMLLCCAIRESMA